MVGVEGIGEAVTGGMLARAVEPDHGEAAGHGTICLNCGAALVGPYCAQCGQKAHVHRSLRGFGHDLLHGVFHFEGKIWRTLPMLAWRPGELTRRYIHGERARFVSPIALFLFSVFLMFAVFSLIGGPFQSNSAATENSAQATAEARADFNREQADRRERLDALRAERQRMAAAGEPTAEVDGRIASQERSIALAQRMFDQTMAVVGGPEEEAAAGAATTREAHRAGSSQSAPPQEDDDLKVNFSGPGSGWLNDAWRHAKENPELLAYKLQSNAYKFSWALIPISVPFVWLLFLHRRRYRQYKAYDHTVFVTYSIAFMSLGLIALSLLRPLGLPQVLAGMAIAFVPPIHIFRQLKQAYELRWWSALWRTFVLLNFALIASMLFFMLLVTIGALG